jgi:REP element-mobilizing transposase RayT
MQSAYSRVSDLRTHAALQGVQTSVMAYPRSMTVTADAPGFYHCISRCVRRAWLCGEDPVTGRNFDHRRAWIEQRLIELSESFAVGLYAWAVMSNHTHVVLRIDPTVPQTWSDEETARRWSRLSRTLEPEQPNHIEARVRRLLAQPQRLEEVRRRLGSLSWFMRFLNECVAREANAEDRCTGRFWEGRYKCQALLDESAVLACMAYVDLNPIRAGIADDLAGSEFTTIQRRLRRLETGQDGEADPLGPLAGSDAAPGTGISMGEYVELVDWTGRLVRADKKGFIDARMPDALQAIRGSPDWFAGSAARIEKAFGCAVGTPLSLKAHATATGRAYVRGVTL